MPKTKLNIFQFPGGTCYNGLNENTSPKRGHLPHASGIWKGRNFTNWSIRKCSHFDLLKALLCTFCLWKMSRKRSGFVIYTFLKDIEFTAVKSDAITFKARYAKRVSFVNRRHTRGLLFLYKKMVYKKVIGQTWGRSFPVIKLCWVAHPGTFSNNLNFTLKYMGYQYWMFQFKLAPRVFFVDFNLPFGFVRQYYELIFS